MNDLLFIYIGIDTERQRDLLRVFALDDFDNDAISKGDNDACDRSIKLGALRLVLSGRMTESSSTEFASRGVVLRFDSDASYSGGSFKLLLESQ